MSSCLISTEHLKLTNLPFGCSYLSFIKWVCHEKKELEHIFKENCTLKKKNRNQFENYAQAKVNLACLSTVPNGYALLITDQRIV